MTNTLSTLAKMKLDVIKYHADTITTNLNGEEITNLKDLVSMARDACYTSNNSVGFVKTSISDTLAEYDQAVEDKNDRQIESSKRYLAILQSRLVSHQERHQADVDVYANLTGGEVWKPTKKGSTSAKTISKGNLEELRKVVA
tara:strand:+ start:77 stop:505 length:429 start_codon:yes stop_codon:yes gene_type:complete